MSRTLIPEGFSLPDREKVKASALLQQERTIVSWDPELGGYVWYTHAHMVDLEHVAFHVLWTDIVWDSAFPELEDEPYLFELMTE